MRENQEWQFSDLVRLWDGMEGCVFSIVYYNFVSCVLLRVRTISNVSRCLYGGMGEQAYLSLFEFFLDSEKYFFMSMMSYE